MMVTTLRRIARAYKTYIQSLSAFPLGLKSPFDLHQIYSLIRLTCPGAVTYLVASAILRKSYAYFAQKRPDS